LKERSGDFHYSQVKHSSRLDQRH